MSDPASTASRAAARLQRLGRTIVTPKVGALLFMVLLSGALWVRGATYIEDVSSTLMGIRELVAGDSEHYMAIAYSMREGDLRMAHVEPTGGADRAHRQPGFPALLALAGKLGVQGAPNLARVNLALVVASLWIAFLGARWATGSVLGALLAAAVVYNAHFLFQIATQRLLSEPLFVAVALAALSAWLSYIRHPSIVSLWFTAALGAATYLVRVNGLFLCTSLGLGLLLADLLRARREDPKIPAQHLTLQLPLAAYGAALALFVVVAIPSWLPRAIYAGDPTYHGYLTNYLWVDDYDRAHVPGPPIYTFATYAQEHDTGDALDRIAYGLQRVFWDTPRDKFGAPTCVAMIVALVVVVVLRDPAGIALVVFGVLQAMPLVWTALSNPVRRLPAAALLPFVALLVAVAAAALLRRVRENPDN